MDLKSFSYRLIFSFLIFVAWINLNFGFNLETRLPVIKRGTPNTYFGYSVAEHQSVNEITSEITHSWLLVGAPLGKNLQPGTNRSGALFRCPITEVNEFDCEQVITDGKRELDSDFLSEPAMDELKEGQWLGVTVRSQGPGKKVLVCAHRYISRGDTYHWGWGLCYTLTQMLDYDSAWEFCRGRPTDNAHEQYGFCQIGTSGALLDGDMAVIGSPGPYTWRGTAFVVNISDNYLERDKTIYQVPVDSSTSPVPKYSYLGMSVTGGKFLNANHTTYVAGAPRAHETGEVVLFSKPTSNSNLMNVDAVLKGEQFSSSFGYEVATADVNGDGLPDLLVGAPFYFDKNEGGAVYIYLNKDYCLTCLNVGKITGKLESRFGFAIANLGDINKDGFDDIAVGAPYEGNGKVYIYLGSTNGLIPTASQVISPESSKPLNGIKTFGYSLSGGMDLDRNDYPDLLIGAYESDTVVLLRARPIIELDTTIGPKRALREIDPSKHGCEKDPDSKNTCFSFQSCVTVLTVDKQNRGLKLEDGDGLTLHYKLESDYKRKISRVWLGHDSTERPISIQNNITLQRNAKNELTHCQEHIVYIKETAKDIQSPIEFKLEYALIQKEPVMPKVGDRFQSVDQYPILNKQEAEKIFQATFLKDCGPDDRCDSQLSIQASLDLPFYDKKYNISKLLIGQDDEITVNIEVFNVNEPAYEAQLFFIHPESLSYKKFYDTSPKKSEGKPISCESNNSTLVICNLGNPFKKLKPAKLQLKFDLKGSNDLLPMLEFTAFANSTSNEIEPLGPTTLRARVIKQAELSIRGLARPETVFFGGEVKGESAIQYTDEIGSRIQHIYQVVNKGPWKVHDLKVNIDWPFEVANNKPHGKWLLYIDEQPTIAATNGGECFLPPEQVNERNFIIRSGVDTPLGVTTQPSVPFTYNSSGIDSGTPHRRTRRDMEMMVRPETTYDVSGKPHKKFRMNCTLGTAKCLKFHCKVKLLEKNQEATIIIKARLWNSTLVEDYLDSEVVEISSKASLSIPYLSVDNIEQQDTKDDQFEVVTEAKVEDLQLKPEEVDWWIYILAIVIGLLLLMLLTVLLWKLGFFKRKRMEDPTLSGNLEKHRDY